MQWLITFFWQLPPACFISVNLNIQIRSFNSGRNFWTTFKIDFSSIIFGRSIDTLGKLDLLETLLCFLYLPMLQNMSIFSHIIFNRLNIFHKLIKDINVALYVDFAASNLGIFEIFHMFDQMWPHNGKLFISLGAFVMNLYFDILRDISSLVNYWYFIYRDIFKLLCLGFSFGNVLWLLLRFDWLFLEEVRCFLHKVYLFRYGHLYFYRARRFDGFSFILFS